MATANKFEQFAEDLGLGVHNLSTHTLKVYLSNTEPSASADAVKADLAEITNENGYTAPVDVQNTWAETGGTATLTGAKVTITASSGTVGPFQYVVLYNEDPTSPADPLIQWWDRGSAVTLQDGESFAIKFNNSDTTGTILTLA
jgi:hypothetical protein